MSEKTNFNYKTVLITGGAGFIGSNIAFYLQTNFPKCNIIIFDKFRDEQIFTNGNLQSFGHYANLIGFRGDVICGDICSKDDLHLLKKYNIDYIFHQAAISDTRVYDQKMVMKSNINSFYDILNLSLDNNATLIYASSAAVYGDLTSPQVVGKESPQNPYGYSKYAMDQIAKDYIVKYKNLRIFGLRYFNVYGPGEFYKNKTSSMIIQLAHQILSGGAAGLFNDSDSIYRDFIYIDDVVEANILCCSSKNSGIYNIGTGQPESFGSIVKFLQDHLGMCKIKYFENPYKEGYQYHTEAEIDKTLKGIKFKAKVNLEEGVKRYIPYLKKMNGRNKI